MRAFAAASPVRDLPVFTVGDATAAAARACGYADVRSAEKATSPRWTVLFAAEAPPGRVLAPGALRPAGRLARAERLAVYDTRALPGPWPLAADAVAAGRLAAILVQSPSAAQALAASDHPALAAAAAWLATSSACAAPLLAAGLADVRIADTPRDDALLRLLAPARAAPWQAAPPRL